MTFFKRISDPLILEKHTYTFNLNQIHMLNKLVLNEVIRFKL